MKKISSKIIISVLLAIFLWGGVNFNSEKGSVDFSLKIQNVLAAIDCTALQNAARPTALNSPERQAARTCLEQQQAENNAASEAANNELADAKNTKWYSFITKGLSFLVEGPLKIAIAITAGFWQLLIIPILGVFLRITAFLLDQSVLFTLESANISNVNTAIVKIWELVRNVFNITFIFILLYTAIRTIIGSANANTKKTLANVIIAALLINFSLFITKIIIDAGNILAVALYNQAITGTNTMSSVMMDSLHIGALWATTNTESVFSTAFFIITALQALTIIVATIALGYVALLMLVRNVMLIFLMAISPIGFMGDVIPFISQYSKMWWENLYGQVFVAPVFLLFFYLITMIGTKLTITGTTQDNVDFTTYFQYIMIIILLVAAVKMTKKMSGVMGGLVEGAVKLAISAAVGAATGGAALALRGTVGRKALSMAQDQGLNARAAAGDVGARMQLATAKKLSGMSFDARNTGVFKKATDIIGDQAGLKINFAEATNIQKGGYAGMIKEKEKKADEEIKAMTKTVKVADEEILAEIDVMANARSEMARLRNVASRTPEQDRDLAMYQEDERKYNERFKGIDGAKDKKEFVKKVLEKEKKDALAETLAQREEKKITNRFFGGAKEKAQKIRDSKKEKSEGEKLQEAIDKAAKKKSEDEKGEEKGKEKKEEKKDEGGGEKKEEKKEEGEKK